jgi:hypothetical protein
MLAAVGVEQGNAQLGGSGAITDRYGSFYAYSAKTLPFPSFYMFQNTHYFKGTGDRGGSSSPVKDFGTQLGIQVGVTQSFDIILTGNFVQTSNLAPGISNKEIVSLFKSYDVPDEFFLNFRLLPYAFSQNKIRLGFMLTTRFQGSGFYNTPLRPYSGGHTEAGLGILTSFFSEPDYSEAGFSAHLNLQYWNHLDNGVYLGFKDENDLRTDPAKQPTGNSLADTAVVTSNASSFRFALGSSYPIEISGRYLVLTGDLYGNIFLKKPSKVAYSRQNYAYAALGLRFQLFDWMGIHLGGEYQVLKGTEKTFSNDNLLGIDDLTISKSDYPTWRFFSGLTFPIMPHMEAPKSRVKEEVVEEQSVRHKREVEGILYSEQEIQKRSQNFIPVREMRKNYKNVIGEYVVILEKKDKKLVEPGATDEQENSGN